MYASIDETYYPVSKICLPIEIINGECYVGVIFKTSRMSKTIYEAAKLDPESIINKYEDWILRARETRTGVYVSWKKQFQNINTLCPCKQLKDFVRKYRIGRYYLHAKELNRC